MLQDHQENIWIKVENFIDQICSFRDISPTIRLEIFKYIFSFPCFYDWLSLVFREIYNYLMSSSTHGCRSVYCGSGLYYYIKTCIRDKLTNICQVGLFLSCTTLFTYILEYQ